MTTKLFSELGLSPEMLKAIDKLGFEKAAPIQAEAIPMLMKGQDVVGQSQTGSGKTAAFAIPAIEKCDPTDKSVQVLILCPTRELAVQVSEDVHHLACFKRGIHALPIYGGQSYDRQFYGLKQGVQIVIGTPGRLMDHMERGTLRLNAIRMVILDEADVMLDMGFRDDIETILKATPSERQTVFFSATMPRPIQDLIHRYARNPVQARIEQKTVTVPTVEQIYYEVDRRFKVELLTRLIDLHDFKSGIIFCNTKRMVDDLVEHLNAQGYSADRLHGDLSQAMRDRVMNKFRKSHLEFLVATDVAARGIDVDDVQVVINYDLPHDVEDYVHRIGRTGRAGREGRAISFVAGREIFLIQQIERFTRVRMERGKPPSQSEVEQARGAVFLEKLRAVLATTAHKRHQYLVQILLDEGFNSIDIASALIQQLLDGESSSTSPREEIPAARERRPERAARSDAERRPERSPRGDFPQRPERGHPPERPPRRIVPPGPDRAARASIERKPSRPVRDPASKPAPWVPAPAPPEATPRRPAREHAKAPAAAPKPAGPAQGSDVKRSRRTPEGQTRLFMSIGEEMGVSREDVARTVMGETGLPGAVVGEVDIRKRHLFVDVAAEHANAIISKLNRSRLKGHKLKVKNVSKETSGDEPA